MAARCSVQRNIDAVVMQITGKISAACTTKADRPGLAGVSQQLIDAWNVPRCGSTRQKGGDTTPLARSRM
jgi:hypothetical protein